MVGVVAFCGLAGGALLWASDEPAERAGNRLGQATQQIATKVASLRGDPLLDGLAELEPAPAAGGSEDPGQPASLEAVATAPEGPTLALDTTLDTAAGKEGAQPQAAGNELEAAEPSESPPAEPGKERPPADAGPPEEPVPDPAPEPPAEEPPVESCGFVTCGSGEVCCNASCGTCVPEGESCDTTPCTPRIQIPTAPISMRCGQNTCNVGEVCCNASCGTCVAPGQSCDEAPCAPRTRTPELAVSVMCGQNTCSVGEVCCNASCGTCVAEGQSCDEAPCMPRIRYW